MAGDDRRMVSEFIASPQNSMYPLPAYAPYEFDIPLTYEAAAPRSWIQQSAKFGAVWVPKVVAKFSKPSTNGAATGEQGISIVNGPTHGDIEPLDVIQLLWM